MKYLQKTGIRILISLFAGGMVAEILHITTGDPNRPEGNGSSFIVLGVAFIAYLLLTAISQKAK
jgi:hypothetical protein